MYTERNEAVRSCDNGRFWFSLYIPNETRPLGYGITAEFGSVYSNMTTDQDNGLKMVAIY